MTSQTSDVSPAAAQTPLVDVWLDDLEQLPATQRDWIWPGYLARGAVTLLTSQWKAGKTTLLSLLLARLKGGGEVGGLTVQPARAVVVTEEPLDLWRERHERLQFARDT